MITDSENIFHSQNVCCQVFQLYSKSPGSEEICVLLLWNRTSIMWGVKRDLHKHHLNLMVYLTRRRINHKPNLTKRIVKIFPLIAVFGPCCTTHQWISKRKVKPNVNWSRAKAKERRRRKKYVNSIKFNRIKGAKAYTEHTQTETHTHTSLPLCSWQSPQKLYVNAKWTVGKWG